MSRHPRASRRWLALICIALIPLAPAMVTPSITRADTDLTLGGEAVVSYANGDAVRLRASLGLGGEILRYVPEGSTVDVLDGPIASDDGTFWYQVSWDGSSGHMISDYLASGDSSIPGGADVLSYATTTSVLNLRSGPSTNYSVISVMPAGAEVGVTGDPQAGFYPVRYGSSDGWASSDYLDLGGNAGTPSPTGSAVTTSDLNLRTGPGTDYPVILMMPSGAGLELLGESSNGFLSASYQGSEGWASSDYLDTSGGGDDGGDVVDAAVTTSALNLRSGPGTGYGVLLVMPSGAEVGITGDVENGFYPVRYAGTDGFASATYLDIGDGGGDGTAGGYIQFPFSGGAWTIIQGYNTGTHINRSEQAQYMYSLDWARTDGNTAGQPIYAPVSGTIRWVDSPSGGLAIDIGNGFVVCLFHLEIDGWGRGDDINQGDYVGTIAEAGARGNNGYPHVDTTLWASSDGTRTRTAEPWVGANALGGIEFPDIGGSNQHYGEVVYP